MVEPGVAWSLEGVPNGLGDCARPETTHARSAAATTTVIGPKARRPDPGEIRKILGTAESYLRCTACRVHRLSHSLSNGILQARDVELFTPAKQERPACLRLCFVPVHPAIG